MLGMDPIGFRSVSEVQSSALGTSQYPAFLPSIGLIMATGSGGGIVIPIIVWQLKQQGNA